jgi:hypothetical protein
METDYVHIYYTLTLTICQAELYVYSLPWDGGGFAVSPSSGIKTSKGPAFARAGPWQCFK